MKIIIALLVATLLTACGGGGGGGGSAGTTVTGTVSGLATGSQFVLSDSTVITSNGSVTLNTSTPSITEQPYNQSCTVSGTAITCTNLATPYQSNGFVVPMWSYTNHADTVQSLTTLKRNTKANTIIVDFHLTTPSLTSNEITIQNLAQVNSLSDVLQTAKSLGFDVWFKPIIIVGANGTNWQQLSPTNPAQWFANYSTVLNSLADTIAPYHTSHFLITNELHSMTTNVAYSANWATLITSLRTHYTGKIGFNAGGLLGTCGACSEFSDIPAATLANIDFMGISAYPRLLSPQSFTVANIIAGWINDLYGNNLQTQVNNFIDANPTLPVFMSELGSPVLWGGNANPTQSADPVSQTAFYEGSLQKITTDMRKLDGVFVYNWILHVDNSAPVDINSVTAWDMYNRSANHTVFSSTWSTLRTQQ